MLTQPMDILEKFPFRKNRKQKQSFRDAVQSYAEGLSYPVQIEKGSLGSRNIVIGDPERARFLITAHYDTPASIGLPNIITPKNLLFYILWQILLLGVFFAFAFAVGIPVAILTGDSYFGFLSGYFAYFGLLILMMVGPANRHNANDNTSGVVTVLEIAKTMPENLRSKVCFVLFDLEEAGLVGSASYRKAHKAATENQIILNLDCVGDGDEIVLFPTKKLKKQESTMTSLDKVSGSFGNKSIALHKKGFSIYPSDQKNFPFGVGIAAFRRHKLLGLYCSRIHTWRDTILEQTNVNILRAALVSLIANDK